MSEAQERKLGTCDLLEVGHYNVLHPYSEWTCVKWREPAQPSRYTEHSSECSYWATNVCNCAAQPSPVNNAPYGMNKDTGWPKTEAAVQPSPEICPTCGSRERWLRHSPAPHSLGSYTQCRDEWHQAGEPRTFLPDFAHCFHCKKADNLHKPAEAGLLCPDTAPAVESLTPEQFWQTWTPLTETERLFQDKKILFVMFTFAEAFAHQVRQEAERAYPNVYKGLWADYQNAQANIARLTAENATRDKENAGLRKRIHNLEQHNQYFFRCESAWCIPSEGDNPALEDLKQVMELRECAETALRASRDKLQRGRWVVSFGTQEAVAADDINSLTKEQTEDVAQRGGTLKFVVEPLTLKEVADLALRGKTEDLLFGEQPSA